MGWAMNLLSDLEISESIVGRYLESHESYSESGLEYWACCNGFENRVDDLLIVFRNTEIKR